MTWCCLVRHAARAAEPTRPAEACQYACQRIWRCFYEYEDRRVPAAPIMRIFMDVFGKVSRLETYGYEGY